MARFEVDGDDLVLRFSFWEKVGGVRRGARIPLAQVASVEVAGDPWSIATGLRVGTGVPYGILLGTMVRGGANDVVAIYGRRPAVVVHLRPGARWQRLIATVDDPAATVARLEAARG